MVGPEGVLKSLILLSFSWAKIRNLPVSFRMIPPPDYCYFGVGQILAGVPSIRYSPLWPILRSANFYAFLNTAAYCSEIWRGAIQAIPEAQREAG